MGPTGVGIGVPVATVLSANQQTGAPVDQTAQMNTFRSYVSMLADPGSKDENKLKAAQALNEDLEVIYKVFSF